MKMRVRPDCKHSIINAFAGREFVKYEWRDVPVGNEVEAGSHPFLEIQSPDDEVDFTLPPGSIDDAYPKATPSKPAAKKTAVKKPPVRRKRKPKKAAKGRGNG